MKHGTGVYGLIRDDLRRVDGKMRESPCLLDPTSFRQATVARRENLPTVLAAAVDQLLSSGGKRIRPTLTLLVGRVFPGCQDEIVALAAAIEMLHTATLVHDDLIDGAPLRRGNPTLNATWSPGASILAGDLLFARSADLAAQTGNVHVMRLFGQTLAVVCSGEIRQLFGTHTIPDREQYYHRIYAKTASLFALAAEAPGVLGGAPESAVRALRTYGENLGMAHQIVDDILDFVGNKDRLGKPVGNDLRAGLVTAPTLWYLEQNKGCELINDILSIGGRDSEAVREAMRIICESGAINASFDEASHFVKNGEKALTALPSSKYRDALFDVGRLIAEREY